MDLPHKKPNWLCEIEDVTNDTILSWIIFLRTLETLHKSETYGIKSLYCKTSLKLIKTKQMQAFLCGKKVFKNVIVECTTNCANHLVV